MPQQQRFLGPFTSKKWMGGGAGGLGFAFCLINKLLCPGNERQSGMCLVLALNRWDSQVKWNME